MEIIPPATSEELVEILSQLGAVGYSADEAAENLLNALEAFGISAETIAEEVQEQRGR